METPLTPAEIAENERIKNMPVIKELHSDLEGLKEGQQNLNDKVDTGFEKVEESFKKGTKRMDGIEEDVKKIIDMIIDDNKKRDGQHHDVMRQISDNEITRLQKKIEERDEAVKTNDNRAWEAIKIGLTAVVSILVTYFLVKFGLK